LKIVKTIVGGLKAELSAVVERLRMPRLWKFIAVVFGLSLVVGFLELIFVAGKTTSEQRSSIAIERYSIESKRLIKEAEKLAISSRDILARDETLIQAVDSKDRKHILREVYIRDSLLRNNQGDINGVHSGDDFAFAVYDSSARIVGWNSGATLGNDVDTIFSPIFDISKRVKGVFFEETQSKQYITAFHKLFTSDQKYVGYIVIKLFISDKDLPTLPLQSTAHSDLFSDLEKKESILIRLTSKTPDKSSGDSILSHSSVPFEEGGPLSTIHVTIRQPSSEVSSSFEWDALSAIRDLLVLLLISTIFFALYAIHIYKAKTLLTLRIVVYQTVSIILYGVIFRCVLYLVGSGHALLPSSLNLTSDFAYQSLPMLSDPLELALSSYIVASIFFSLFLLYTSKEVSVILANNKLPFWIGMVVSFISAITCLSLFLSWFTGLVTNNCSFDLSALLEPLALTKFLLPLLSLLIVTVSIIALGIGLPDFLIHLRSSRTVSLKVVRLVLSIVILTSILVQVLFGGELADIGAFSILVSGLLSLASTIQFRFTPPGYELTRSPIIALTLASLACFILAPAIERTNFIKQQQNLEQSILSKAGFQFSTAALQLPESLHSPGSLLTRDTITSSLRLPMLLLQEHERLESEIQGANFLLMVHNLNDSLIYSVGSRIEPAKNSSELISITTPIYIIANSDSGGALSAEKYNYTAVMTNDLLDISSSEVNSFLLLYNNDKLERSSQSTLSIPVTLLSDVKKVSTKGSWVPIEIEGKDVALYVKSIYSINSNTPEKILVGGLIEYSFADTLLFAIRYNTLSLVLAAFVILLTLALTNNISLMRYTLRFRERIFLIIFLIALVPLVFVSNITRTVLQSRESEDQRQSLIAESEKVAAVVRPLFDGNRKLLSPLILDLSRTLEHRIDVYDGNGILLSSSAPELYDSFMLSRLLSLDVYYSAVVHEQTGSYQEREILDQRIITSYQSIYDGSYNTLLGIVAITRADDLTISANELASTASLIYGTFSLVALLLLIIGSYVSYRVASPLQDMISATERVARGELGTQVSFNRKDEIGDLASAFNRMTKELESTRNRAAQSEREGAWKEMARQVAHEIKNPLTPMKLSVQHVQHAHEVKDTNFSAVFTRVMKTLSEQIDVLTRIASEFSRFGEMPRRRYAFVSLKKVVESALSLFDAERAHIRFVADIPDKISSIYADEEEFRRTLVNLLRNSVQAMDGWGMIVITASESNGIIHLSIKDTGVGMSEETLNKAFDPNFSTKTSGMGLGLAIVKRTITDMSGTIRVESTIGKGTTFHIELPARTV